MLPPIPQLSDYGISPEYGFLPSVLPLERLPDPYYHKWEAVVANLQGLLLSKRIRGVVDRLPILSTVGLEHDAEWRRAHMLLSFMAHGYIWGGDNPAEKIPPSISIPYLKVSAHLEVPPVATYASTVLWNFKPLFADEHIDNLENLSTLTTFSGSIDESWFYLVSVAMEARGAPIIPLMLAAFAAARAGDSATVTACLRSFAERLDDLGSLLQRMHERCDPHVFYYGIRPFLAGSKNMAEAGLPHGVIYDDGNEAGPHQQARHRQYSGPSNAQSSLIQFFDIALGIEHLPTGVTSQQQKRQQRSGTSARDGTDREEAEEGMAPKPKHNFLQEMRSYMPGPHRRFLADATSVANIRDFVGARRDGDAPLCIAYDACLAMLRALREKHIAIVTRYIILKARESRGAGAGGALAPSSAAGPETARDGGKAGGGGGGGGGGGVRNLATATREGEREHGVKSGKGPTGTGGTALIPFLKQARDETSEPSVNGWARRVMKRSANPRGREDFFLGKEEEQQQQQPVTGWEIGGLAGTWTDSTDGGGICSY